MRQNRLQKKQGPNGAGRESRFGAGRVKQAEPGTRTGRREKDTELETTIQQQTKERLTQYIGGETGVRHQTVTRQEWLRAGAGN